MSFAFITSIGKSITVVLPWVERLLWTQGSYQYTFLFFRISVPHVSAAFVYSDAFKQLIFQLLYCNVLCRNVWYKLFHIFKKKKRVSRAVITPSSKGKKKYRYAYTYTHILGAIRKEIALVSAAHSFIPTLFTEGNKFLFYCK